jgi:hypothetical protein
MKKTFADIDKDPCITSGGGVYGQEDPYVIPP